MELYPLFLATVKGVDDVLVYQSKDCGIKVSMDFSGNYLKCTSRYDDAFTNLRPAKVVDVDAVVISHKAWERIEKLYKLNPQRERFLGDFVSDIAEVRRVILNENPHLEPVTEPKGFGAIVEAATKWHGFQSWFRAKDGVWTGEREDHVEFGDFINPTILSEGLK